MADNQTPEGISRGVEKRKQTLLQRKQAELAAKELAIKEAAELRFGVTQAKAELAVLLAEVASLKKLMQLDFGHLIAGGIDGLLTEDEIVALASKVPSLIGVYFLVSGNEVVYVGQSKTVFQRIETHRRDRSKLFDRVCFIPCDEAILDVLESLYIHTLRPRLNGRYSSGVTGAPISLRECMNLIKEAKDKKIKKTAQAAQIIHIKATDSRDVMRALRSGGFLPRAPLGDPDRA